jgi:FkbM family methyltransferase
MEMMMWLLGKFLSRLRIWLTILWNFRSIKFHGWLNLFLSTLIDPIIYALSSTSLNPKLVMKGLYLFRVKGLGIVLCRGGTDDVFQFVPGREGDVEEYIKSHLKEGSIFVDVGANVGYYTLIASRLVGSRGRVYAVEPAPSTAAILRLNVRLNKLDNVIIIEKAAWFTKEKLILRIPGSDYGYASVVRGDGKNMLVEACPLDELLQDVDHIDILKIDVEGAEYEVLKGAKNTLHKTKCIVLELTRNVKEVFELLMNYGFKIKKAELPAYIIAYRG